MKYQLGDQVKHLGVNHPFTKQPAIGLVSGFTGDGSVMVRFPEPLRTLKVWPDDLVMVRPFSPPRCEEEGPNGQCDRPQGHDGECLRKGYPIDPDETTYPLIGEYVDKELMTMTDAAETAARAAVREDRHPCTVHLLDLFEYGHLPPHLAVISAKFEALAHDLVTHLKDGPELTAGLRKLVEAKDACVRQAVIDAWTSDD